VPESSFGGVRIADRVRTTVPDGWTSNGESPIAVRDESVTWYVHTVDLAHRNEDISGWIQ